MSAAPDLGVTVDDVREIMDTQSTAGSIETAISAAEVIISDELGDVPVSAQRRTLIASYLACHFVANDPPEKESSVGDMRWNYERDDSGTGLAETRFGRRAIDLDPTGRLDSRNQDEPEFESLGLRG